MVQDTCVLTPYLLSFSWGGLNLPALPAKGRCSGSCTPALLQSSVIAKRPVHLTIFPDLPTRSNHVLTPDPPCHLSSDSFPGSWSLSLPCQAHWVSLEADRRMWHYPPLSGSQTKILVGRRQKGGGKWTLVKGLMLKHCIPETQSRKTL